MLESQGMNLHFEGKTSRALLNCCIRTDKNLLNKFQVQWLRMIRSFVFLTESKIKKRERKKLRDKIEFKKN